MKIIIGLGNPEKEYDGTRHNVGFMVLDKIIKKDKWREDDKKILLSAKDGEGKKKAEFVKPQTFMNNSGKVISALKKKYPKFSPSEVLIVHDDLDIEIGKLKLTYGKSAAKHKGVESIIKSLRTKNFWRLRVGILPNRKPDTKKMKNFLLKKFTPAEQTKIKKIVKKSAEGIELWLENPAGAMNFVNRK